MKKKNSLFPFYNENYLINKRNSFFSESSNISLMPTSESLIMNVLLNTHRIKKNREKFFNEKNYNKQQKTLDVNNLYSNYLKQKVKYIIPYIQKKSKSNDKEEQLEINNYSETKLSKSMFKFPSNISKNISQEMFNGKNIIPKDFGKYCVKLHYMKNIMKLNKDLLNKEVIKKEKIEKEMNQTLDYWDKKLNHINNYFIPNYTNYIVFLREKIKKERKILNDIIRKQIRLNYQIDNLKFKYNKIMFKYISYIKLRNILVCIKENINEKDLPEIFNDITYETMINLKEKFKQLRKERKIATLTEQKNLKYKSIIRQISFSPQSILNLQFKNNENDKKNNENEQIKNNNENNINDNINYQNIEKYLDSNYIIFDSLRDIMNIFQRKRNKINNLYKNYYYNYSICNSLKVEFENKGKNSGKIDLTEKEKENELIEKLNSLKNKNKELITQLNIINKNQNKIVKRSLNNYLMKLSKEYTIDFSMSILKLQNYYQEKNFKKNFAYVYFYIGEMAKNLYLMNKKLFYESNRNFNENNFFNMINIIVNPDINDENNLNKLSILILKIYDNTVLNFLIKYNKIISQVKNTTFFNNIMKKKKNVKSQKIIEKKKYINEEIEIRKYNKLISNNNKIMFLSNCKSFVNFAPQKKIKKETSNLEMNYSSLIY